MTTSRLVKRVRSERVTTTLDENGLRVRKISPGHKGKIGGRYCYIVGKNMKLDNLKIAKEICKNFDTDTYWDTLSSTKERILFFNNEEDMTYFILGYQEND